LRGRFRRQRFDLLRSQQQVGCGTAVEELDQLERGCDLRGPFDGSFKELSAVEVILGIDRALTPKNLAMLGQNHGREIFGPYDRQRVFGMLEHQFEMGIRMPNELKFDLLDFVIDGNRADTAEGELWGLELEGFEPRIEL